MKKALITGITGQDGAYLAKLLVDNGYKVVGLTRNSYSTGVKNLKYLGIEKDVCLVEANLLDLSNLIRLIEKIEPDEIYNLAAQSSVAFSFNQPIGTIEFNIISTMNLLEAIRHANAKIKYYQASSSEMFGNVKKECLPINENIVFHPVSPYAISKATAHWITVNYREAYGLFATCGVLFNHESALRNEKFVTKKVLNGAVKIKMGLLKNITLGNLNIYRDWGYAPEYVKAMYLMLQQENAEDFIICSGEVTSLKEFSMKVFERLELDFEKYAIIDNNLFRPVDLGIIYGNNTKAKSLLGWQYNMTFSQLIDTLIKDEIQHIEWELHAGCA